MSDIKWDIAEKINKCGYDMMTSLDMAYELIEEFLASGQQEATYGIMVGKKCKEVIAIARKKKVKS